MKTTLSRGTRKEGIKYFEREDWQLVKAVLPKRRIWRMTSRKSRLKFKNCAGKKAKGCASAWWNSERIKAREVSQGEEQLRGGPRCLKAASLPSGLFFVVRGETNLGKCE